MNHWIYAAIFFVIALVSFGVGAIAAADPEGRGAGYAMIGVLIAVVFAGLFLAASFGFIGTTK